MGSVLPNEHEKYAENNKAREKWYMERKSERRSKMRGEWELVLLMGLMDSFGNGLIDRVK